MQHQVDCFVENLLAWYDVNKRTLAWRSDPTPYKVWVSEIMLQQTRVEAVKPYFERWMQEVPTLHDLANTSEDKLCKLWEGLGYYSRVRNMKKCAQVCVEFHSSQLPNSYEQLIKLPGIGSYTAGAIASIAYGECVPAVDGNVMRVFARQKRIYEDILSAKTKRYFETLVQSYVPRNRPSDFNQAVMELGALICIPQARCNICPIQEQCGAYKHGEVYQLPIKKVKAKRKLENKTILCVICEDKVRIHQRGKGLLENLYEFDALDGYYSLDEIQSMYQDATISKLQDSKHIFSHIEWHMQGYLVLVAKQNEGNFIKQEELLEKYPIPTALQVYKKAVVQYMSRNAIKQVEAYQPYDNEERNTKQYIVDHLQDFDTYLTRKSPIHFTVSTWVMHASKAQVLMVYHLLYNSYSWIGGHVDGMNNWIEVAKKELEEETGIQQYSFIDDIFSMEMLDVKEHIKNGKTVATHTHINITYLVYAKDQELHVNPSENSDVRWMDIDTLKQNVDEKPMLSVYKKLLEKLNIIL